MSRVAQEFLELYGYPPEGVWAAPGRVNLIGEHTDYNDGFALPFALPHRTEVAAARRTDGTLGFHSADVPSGVVRLDLAALDPAHPPRGGAVGRATRPGWCGPSWTPASRSAAWTCTYGPTFRPEPACPPPPRSKWPRPWP